MGPGFVLILWLFFAAIYGAILLVFIGLYVLAWKKKRRWLKWLSAIPVLLMLIFAAFFVIFLGWGYAKLTNPRSVFENTFGCSPPASITNMESSCFWFGDTGSIYVRFGASEEDFKKLMPAHLAQETATEMKQINPDENGGGPAWWDFQIKQDWIYDARIQRVTNIDQLTNNSSRIAASEKGFCQEIEFYAYDPKNKIVYYRFSGWD